MADADSTRGRALEIKDIDPPDLVRARSADWKTITIPLTDDQISQLKELGVDTSEIRIRTFDVARLAQVVPN